MQNFHRAFLAVKPDKATTNFFRDTIRVIQKSARNVRFVAVDQLHLTLQFLGAALSDESIALITSALAATKPESVEIKLTNFHFGFSGQKKPELFFWGVEPTPELKRLTGTLHDTVKRLDLPDVKPQKDYAKLIYHFTLGRTIRSFSKQEVIQLTNKVELAGLIQPPAFKVKEFFLYESIGDRKGNSYKVMRTFPLSG